MRVFKLILFLNLILLSSLLSAETPKKDPTRSLIGVRYFSQTMGNVHQNASRYSQVLTTISCNHPVKILKITSKDGKDLTSLGDPNWTFVGVGPYEGYIMTSYLNEKKNSCLEEEYSKFFDGLELDINDLYYWARLYDQYVQDKSKVRQ